MGDLNLISFQLISLSGDSRSLSFEALECAKNGDFEEAENKLNQAEKKSNEAHKVQFELLSKESNGENIHFSILLVHAQDHLMTSMLALDFAKYQIEILKRR